MAGRQRTFELIPTSMVKSNASKPPMTSKAAKKAHQLATKGPRISRAEQRRRDAEELAQQRKEYEREKAAARAKAAREKKAAKEQAEKQARRKMGIPEPSKFVRASQPTISRFVKSGSKRTWQEMNPIAEESDGTVCDVEAEQTVEEPPVSVKKFVAGEDSEDEYGEFPSFSQSEFPDLLETLDNSTPLAQNQDIQSASNHTMQPMPDSKPREVVELLPMEDSTDERGFSWDFAGMTASQLLSEGAGVAARFTKEEKPPTPKSQPKFRPPTVKTTSRPALKERSANMLPPPIPIKAKKSTFSTPISHKSRNTPITAFKSASKACSNAPPSATQAFLEDHIDDFFPSPSQQIRELLDDIDDMPTNTQITRELQASLPSKITWDCDFAHDETFLDFICTTVSSQDLREVIQEITTPCPPRPERLQKLAQLGSRRPRDRFFEEREEDLARAAKLESIKLTAPEERERHGSRLFGEGKSYVAQKEPHRQESEPFRRTSRVLKRTESNATDYGEDDFNDCEQELLALC